MYAITYIDRVNVSTAASVFQHELHLTSTQVGLVFSAFAYPYLVFQIIGGWVSDRYGARLTLTVSAIIWAVATLLTGLAGSLATMLAARVMLGLRRRRNLSRRDPRYVRLDRRGQARLLSGHHSLQRAPRKRPHPTSRGLAHGPRHLARLVRHPRRHQHGLGAGLGLVLPQ